MSISTSETVPYDIDKPGVILRVRYYEPEFPGAVEVTQKRTPTGAFAAVVASFRATQRVRKSFVLFASTQLFRSEGHSYCSG